jgi:hypothetical protein
MDVFYANIFCLYVYKDENRASKVPHKRQNKKETKVFLFRIFSSICRRSFACWKRVGKIHCEEVKKEK